MINSIVNFIDKYEEDSEKRFREDDDFLKGIKHACGIFRDYMKQWNKIELQGKQMHDFLKQHLG